MTYTEVVSVKIPTKLLEQMPAAGNGRSGFILEAIEEKVARRQPVRWKAKTNRGRRLAALLKAGRMERRPLLSEAQIEEEFRERRGRRF